MLPPCPRCEPPRPAMTLKPFRLMLLCAAAAFAVLLSWCAARPASAPPAPLPAAPPATAGAKGAWFGEVGTAHPPLSFDDQVPLATQVDKLVATHDPEDAYSAYWLVNRCVALKTGGLMQRDDHSATGMRGLSEQEEKDLAAFCRDMTERMKTSRLDHLSIAAKAGVSGADIAFLHAGPFGDRSALLSRPDDPLVQAWKQQAIDQLRGQAGNGAMASIAILSGLYAGGGEVVEKNQALSLTYTIALHDIYDALSKRARHRFPNPFDDASMRAREEGLSPQQVAAAAAAGKAMAARTTENWQRHR